MISGNSHSHKEIHEMEYLDEEGNVYVIVYDE